MSIRLNRPSDIMAYFDLTLGEFNEFWKSLTPGEKHEWLSADIPRWW